MKLRYLYEQVELTQDCELGKQGELAQVVAHDGRYMSLWFFERDEVVHTGADYKFLHTREGRWMRDGRCLKYDGVPAIGIDRAIDDNGRGKLSPVTCDAIADYVCAALNAVDIDKLTSEWMLKP